jgi:hypothetical protein
MLGSIFFTIYVVFIAGVYLSNSKKNALILNTLCCLSCSIYLFTVGGYSGVVACFAAAGGSLYQLYMYQTVGAENITKKIMLYKLLGSTLFASIGIYFLYENTSSLFLITAIIACRGSEMLNKTRYIKVGYLFAESMWFVYAAHNGFLGMYFVHLTMILIGLFTIYVLPKIKERFTFPTLQLAN